jgi:Anti-sigma-K factor rskA/Putative zinc-finger
VGAVRHECLVQPEDLGPFLLGQLPREEEARVAEAVAGCPSCADEARALRPVVISLRLAATAPPEPAGSTEVAAVQLLRSTEFDRLLASVRAERSRRRARTRRRGALVGAAAAAVLLLAVVVGVGALDRDDPKAATGAQVTLVGSGGAHGSAVVERRDWGTAIMLNVRGLPPGRYGAWLQDWSGQRAPAGTFKLGSDGATHLELSVLMRLDDAASVGVTRIGGRDVLMHKF